MRGSILSVVILLSFSSLTTTNIYNHSVSLIDSGGNQSLSAFQGKKILVVTLPIQQSASTDAMLVSLDSLASVHATTLKVIAVPGKEDGCLPYLEDELETWYRSKLGSGIIVTSGLSVRKSSGTEQHPLFMWLTNDQQNLSFGVDADAPGYKFFTNNEGELIGVLRPQTKISSSAVNKVLQLQ